MIMRSAVLFTVRVQSATGMRRKNVTLWSNPLLPAEGDRELHSSVIRRSITPDPEAVEGVTNSDCVELPLLNAEALNTAGKKVIIKNL